MQNRRQFMRTLGLGIGSLGLASLAKETAPVRPNILLMTVDDMNCDSVGAYGCVVPGTTPNIDRLASEGLRFTRAHVTIAVCQPCRGAIATGRYPVHSGIEGFQRLADLGIPTVHELLRDAGYLTGVMGKGHHADPKPGYQWDLQPKNVGQGRTPELYYRELLGFFKRAAAEGKPFYMNANSHDPHRPFHGSDQERHKFKTIDFPPPSRVFTPEEVKVPGFLPDLPEIRREIAEYYSSVRRADDTVGAVLRALSDAGVAQNTLVVFLSDHGMALPFAKTNCYFHSTHTPWIVRWPGHVAPGTVDTEHFISCIDFMPTVLTAAGAELPKELDGQSFLPVLEGRRQSGFENVFTQFHETAGLRRFPMRAVQGRRFGYIVNFWSDGERVFKNESQSGRTFKAMQAAAAHDPDVAARVKLFQYRVPEEFYDFQTDPDALHNLIDDPAYREDLERMRAMLEAWMERTNDPALTAFRQRGKPEEVAVFMSEQDAKAAARKKHRKGHWKKGKRKRN